MVCIELERSLQRFDSFRLIAILEEGHAVVKLHDRLIGELLSSFLEQGCRLHVDFFLVVDPPDRIGHTGVIRQELASCLGIAQGDVRIATMLDHQPG